MGAKMDRFKAAFRSRSSNQARFERRRVKVAEALHQLEVSIGDLAPHQDPQAMRERWTVLDTSLRMAVQGAASGGHVEAYAQLSQVKDEARTLAKAVAERARRKEVVESTGRGQAAAARAAMTALGNLERVVDGLPAELAAVQRRYSREHQRLAERAGAVGGRDAAKKLKAIVDECNAAIIKCNDFANLRETLPVQVGGQDVTVDRRSLPGFDKLDRAGRDRVRREIGQKIADGQALVDHVLDPAVDPRTLAPPTRKQVADLLWYLKTVGETKAGEPYERGALTLPDPDGRLRKWLDGVQTSDQDPSGAIYTRASSHLTQHVGVDERGGNVARGIDFYEGDLQDTSLLLPFGMNTALLQSFTADGQQRLYMKMEPESARDSIWWTKKADRDADRMRQLRGERAMDLPEDRARTEEDVARSRAHAWEFVASRFSSSSSSGLTVMRESLSDSPAAAVKSAYAAVAAALKGRENLAELRGLLERGLWKKEIGAMVTNVRALRAAIVGLQPRDVRRWEDADIRATGEAANAIEAFSLVLDRELGTGDLNATELIERLGSEVVLSTTDLGLRSAPRRLEVPLYYATVDAVDWTRVKLTMGSAPIPQDARDAVARAHNLHAVPHVRQYDTNPTACVGPLKHGSRHQLVLRLETAGRFIEDVVLVDPWEDVDPMLLAGAARHLEMRLQAGDKLVGDLATARQALQRIQRLRLAAAVYMRTATAASRTGDVVAGRAAQRELTTTLQQGQEALAAISGLTFQLTENGGLNMSARGEFPHREQLPASILEDYTRESGRRFLRVDTLGAELRDVESDANAQLRELEAIVARGAMASPDAPTPEEAVERVDVITGRVSAILRSMESARSRFRKELDTDLPGTLVRYPAPESRMRALELRRGMNQRSANRVGPWRAQLAALERQRGAVHPAVADHEDVAAAADRLRVALEACVAPLAELPQLAQQAEQWTAARIQEAQVEMGG